MGAVDQAQVLVPTQSVFAIEPSPMPFPLCSFKEPPSLLSWNMNLYNGPTFFFSSVNYQLPVLDGSGLTQKVVSGAISAHNLW